MQQLAKKVITNRKLIICSLKVRSVRYPYGLKSPNGNVTSSVNTKQTVRWRALLSCNKTSFPHSTDGAD